MTTRDLVSLLDEARRIRRRHFSDTGLRLRDVAAAIVARLGLQRVRLSLVEIPPGVDAPPSEAPCYRADTDGDVETLPVEQLQFFGRPAVLGDMRAVVTDQVERDDNPCLLVRLRWTHALAWLQLYPAPSADELDELVTGLQRVLLELQPDPASPRNLRRRFFDSLVRYQPTTTAEDHQQICAAWQAVCQADWCWLWLLNRLDPQEAYELTAVASARDRDAPLPHQREAPGRGAVGHFACLSGKPVWIDDVATWNETLAGVEYNVKMMDFFTNVNAASLLCVPLYDPEARGDDGGGLTNVVSLHYDDPGRRPEHDDEILLVMGQLTAMCITRSQEREQHEVLVQLNRIAQAYLTETARGSESRPRYVAELIDLIRTRLHVGYTSVFYRAGFEEAVECIGTTGLRDVATGRQIPLNALSQARYEKGEHYTGHCYENAEPILTDGFEDAVDLKYSERPRSVQQFDPTLYIPIPDGERDGGALGVIRCFDHQSPMFPNDHSLFDRNEVDTLQFIAAQIGPVLRTFEHRIQRERTISTIKHDLTSPLAMMRDAVEALMDDHQAGNPLNPTYLSDIAATINLSMNLVDQLDPDPGAVREFDPRPTLLEGQIVARLKDMLLTIANSRNMDIHFDGFRSVPALNVDPALVERAIYNLLLNAIKYGKAGTTVEVRAAALPDASGYIVDVVNFGIGVEAADAKYLFAPGYRSAAAQRAAMGAGLGLTIAQRAMARHHGTLTLHNRNNPTIFRLFFPADLRA